MIGEAKVPRFPPGSWALVRPEVRTWGGQAGEVVRVFSPPRSAPQAVVYYLALDGDRAGWHEVFFEWELEGPDDLERSGG